VKGDQLRAAYAAARGDVELPDHLAKALAVKRKRADRERQRQKRERRRRAHAKRTNR